MKQHWEDNHTEPLLCTILREVRHEWSEFKSFWKWLFKLKGE